MEYKLYKSYKDLPFNEWETQLHEDDFFLSPMCLRIIEEEHREEITPLYIIIKDEGSVIGIVYAHIFSLNGSKVKDYIDNGNSKFHVLNFLKATSARLLNMDICFLGNTFLTNESSIRISKEYMNTDTILDEVLNTITSKTKAKFILIPESYTNEVRLNGNYLEILVEPDMQLHINKSWLEFNDYLLSIKSKYKKRHRKSIRKSSEIVKRELSIEDLRIESDKMKELFHNVFNKSKFNAAKFNTDVFYDLKLQKNNVSIYGYYLKDELIGFASDISINTVLYAHFVGLNYEVNQSHEIYNRMLYEQIDYAIKNGLELIKFGRTAAEFKSNIGAIPMNDKAYVYHKNKMVLKILKPVLSLLKPKAWTQRNPFK